MTFSVFSCYKLQIQGGSNFLTPAVMGTLEGLQGQIKKVLPGVYHLNLKTDSLEPDINRVWSMIFFVA